MKKQTSQAGRSVSRKARGQQASTRARAGGKGLRVRILACERDESRETTLADVFGVDLMERVLSESLAKGQKVPEFLREAVEARVVAALLARAGAKAPSLAALPLAELLGAEMLAAAEAECAAEGFNLRTLVCEAVALDLRDAEVVRSLFPGGGATLRVPVSKELFGALLARSKQEGIDRAELARRALVNVTAAEAAPDRGREPAASVPLRCETMVDWRRRQRAGKGKSDNVDSLEIEIFGLAQDCVFQRNELIDFICRVLDEHHEYLKKVVVPELDALEQTILMEAISYAQEWRLESDEAGAAPETVRAADLPGIASLRKLTPESFLGWLAYALGCGRVLEAIRRHFLNGTAPANCALQWGEVLAISEAVKRLDDPNSDIAPANGAELKAAALRRVKLNEVTAATVAA